ncbi:MAG: phosphoribosyltransferase [Gammaproteobacteria bacterium]|nr:phosphoribosyltransferase [Gammaproteobacteria bacterium]
MNSTFKNREDAGKQLAKLLKNYKKQNPIILGMPRGGVPVAYEIAKQLKAPLDVIVSRKIGAPGQEEFAIGAIAPGNIMILDQALVSSFSLTKEELIRLVDKEKKEMNRRIKRFRGEKPPLNVKNRTVIIVDDGIATGRTALAAIRAVRKQKPKSIVLAAGACAPDTIAMLEKEADQVICVMKPSPFFAVGSFFDDFGQTTDEEVVELLKK